MCGCDMPNAAEISALDKVQILTTHSGEEYAAGKPKYTKGIVKRVKGKIAYVLWEDQPTSNIGRIVVSSLKGQVNPAEFMDRSHSTESTVPHFSNLDACILRGFPVSGSCLTDSDPNSYGN
jgi:hypothetical protein